jgi:hypothetical protein
MIEVDPAAKIVAIRCGPLFADDDPTCAGMRVRFANIAVHELKIEDLVCHSAA